MLISNSCVFSWFSVCPGLIQYTDRLHKDAQVRKHRACGRFGRMCPVHYRGGRGSLFRNYFWICFCVYHTFHSEHLCNWTAHCLHVQLFVLLICWDPLPLGHPGVSTNQGLFLIAKKEHSGPRPADQPLKLGCNADSQRGGGIRVYQAHVKSDADPLPNTVQHLCVLSSPDRWGEHSKDKVT